MSHRSLLHAWRALVRTDQPGRIVAVFVVSPLLLQKGIAYEDTFIKAFALVLFSWDLWWLLRAAPRSRSPDGCKSV